MQTLIDKNQALKKEIAEIEEKIIVLKKTPVYRKPANPKTKKALQKKKSLFHRAKATFGLADDSKSAPVLTPKQADAIAHVHSLLLQKAYEEVDMFVEQNKKLIFGKTKKGEAVPKPFSLVDEFGESVLMAAIKAGDINLALDWIEKGMVDANVADKDGNTPLMIAAMFGEIEIVEALVKNANRDAKTKFTKKTALHYAAEQNNLEVVLMLIENGVDTSLEDSRGRKAFQAASNVAVKDAIKEVMRKQGKAPTKEEEELEVDEEVEDTIGEKGRSYSTDEEMKPLFAEHKLLLARKKRLELLREDVLRKRSPKTEVSKLLALADKDKEKLLKLQGVDDKVKQFHLLVARGGDDDAVEEVEALLTEKKKDVIDIDAKDQFGETALMKAARLGFQEMLELLLLYKCNTEEKDVEGYTALMKAAQFGKKDIVNKLISEGADVNASSRKGKLNALMLAAERGHTDICEMLIAEGADHSANNSDGKTAVDLAKTEETKAKIEQAMEDYPLSRPAVQI